jgi:hypothetical protein
VRYFFFFLAAFLAGFLVAMGISSLLWLVGSSGTGYTQIHALWQGGKKSARASGTLFNCKQLGGAYFFLAVFLAAFFAGFFAHAMQNHLLVL